jgi:hypothetical protein
MQRPVHLLVLLTAALCVAGTAPVARAARIGVDDVHATNPAEMLGSGEYYAPFRDELAAAGHVLVPLRSFGSADLSGLDGLFLRHAYSVGYTPSEQAAIQAFTRRAVFLSDSTMFADTHSDRPLTFGDNRQLLRNILDYVSAGGGTAFMADGATGADVANFNQLVGPYGVQFAASAIDATGRTVTGFADHPLTAGVTTVGVDFQMPLTVTAPSIDLTTDGGPDNILAVFPVPEPSAVSFLALAAIGLSRRRRSVH